MKYINIKDLEELENEISINNDIQKERNIILEKSNYIQSERNDIMFEMLDDEGKANILRKRLEDLKFAQLQSDLQLSTLNELK